MKRYVFVLGLITVVLALVLAQTAATADCGSCDGKPKMLKDGKGPHGQQGAGCGMMAQGAGAGAGCGMAATQGCPMGGKGMGQGRGRGMGMGMMVAGPVQVNPESQKLWKDLERLQVKRHRAMWDMFRLLGADKVDAAAVQAKQKELWTLNQDMIAKHQALSKFISEAAASACPGCPAMAGASCTCPECAEGCKCCVGGECTCGPDCKCPCCAEGGACKCPGKAGVAAMAGASCTCPECAAKGCKCCVGGECTCGPDCKCPCCAEGGACKCPGKAGVGCAADCKGGPGCAGKPCGAGAARGCGAGAAGGCGGGGAMQ